MLLYYTYAPPERRGGALDPLIVRRSHFMIKIAPLIVRKCFVIVLTAMFMLRRCVCSVPDGALGTRGAPPPSRIREVRIRGFSLIREVKSRGEDSRGEDS